MTLSSTIRTYLGCHNIDKKRTKPDLDGIKLKMAQKLADWKARVLATVDKVVLVKFNLTEIL